MSHTMTLCQDSGVGAPRSTAHRLDLETPRRLHPYPKQGRQLHPTDSERSLQFPHMLQQRLQGIMREGALYL